MDVELRGMAPLLQVYDMAASLKFYCDALGFSVAMTDGRPAGEADWVLLRRGDVELMLNTAYERESRPPSADPARLHAHGDTCLYFGCPDVDAAYAQLQQRGIAANPPQVAPYGMKQLYVTDPDGYGVCFQWPAKP